MRETFTFGCLAGARSIRLQRAGSVVLEPLILFDGSRFAGASLGHSSGGYASEQRSEPAGKEMTTSMMMIMINALANKPPKVDALGLCAVRRLLCQASFG